VSKIAEQLGWMSLVAQWFVWTRRSELPLKVGGLVSGVDDVD